LTRKPAANRQTEQRQLTASTADNPITAALISRDGKYLASEDKDGLSIQEIENGATHKLPGTSGLDIQDWYPDGLHLLVTDDKNDLWTLFAFSEEKHKLTSHVHSAVISPEGSEILFFREPLTHELWTMPAEGGEPQLRFALGQNEIFAGVAWSPDGKAVTYVRADRVSSSATLEIRTFQDAKSRVILTERGLLAGGIAPLEWLPDDRILFGLFKRDTRESDVWAVSLDSSRAAAGKPVRLTNTTGMYVAALSASADGKRVVTLFARYPFVIFVGNLSKTGGELEQPHRLTNDSWTNWPKTWTPDSQTLFYVSTRSNGIYMRRMSSDSSELFAGGSRNYRGGGVSPDGKWVLVSSLREPGQRQLLRVPVSGGNPEAILTLAGPAEVQCAFSGAHICVLSETIGKQEVFSIIDPVRGRLEELAKIEMQDEMNWSLSMDGNRIALVENASDSVRVLNLQTKQIQIIHPTPPQPLLQMAAWSADGTRFFISAFPNSKGRLLEMDAAGHTHLLLENPHGWIGCPVPSPDGRRLAYTYAVPESNVTLLEHF
jgi:Tol biopolymer transport system component